MLRLLAAFFLGLTVLTGAGPVFAQASPAKPASGHGPIHALHITVELVPVSNSIQPGGSAEVGLHMVMDKGWHVYWSNAGDSGEPPQVAWKLPKGITADAMQFPAPERISYGPLMDYGYPDEVVFPIALHAAVGLKAGATEPLGARVNWLVCREECIPGKADFVLPMKVTSQPPTTDAAAAALLQRFQAQLPQPLPPGSKALFQPTPSGFTFALLGSHAGQPASSAEFFPLDQMLISNPAPQTVRESGGNLLIALKKDENLSTAPANLRGVLRFADGVSYQVDAVPGEFAGANFAASPAAGGGQVAATSSETLSHLLRIGVLAFFGGMVLNLMPCVFPVLFLKGLALVGSSGESRRRLRAHGAVYTLGILVSFWAIVAVLLVLRAGGHRLGWGFQFQSPSFLAVIALLFFFLGLSLAGMFDIGLSLTSKGSGLADQGGYGGSFFTGVLAMVVATPCTAPFMGVAVGFALAQPAVIAFAVFTALGLGLAAPFVLLTLHPAWTRLLPRPGAWMEILKQGTAVILFAVAIWMVWLFATAAGVNALSAGLLPGFLLLAIAGWILGRWPARLGASAAALVVIAAAIALPLVAVRSFPAAPSGQMDAANAGGEDWQPFSDAVLQKYRAENRPVFIDFTASWCLSCQVNERVVLDRADVRQRLKDSGIVLLRADWTRHDDAITQALSQLGRSGVPTYVLYPSGGPARVLPEVLTPGIVFNALQGVNASRTDTRAAQGQVTEGAGSGKS
ncbi:MAG TPA: thioredoxin family protein [Acidobacteriaceae bacterium]|jgi:thiol:disulfide interchange protein DsbD|nr:thioredoxin family protein [Acidobacteriaceae bacterium]